MKRKGTIVFTIAGNGINPTEINTIDNFLSKNEEAIRFKKWEQAQI